MEGSDPLVHRHHYNRGGGGGGGGGWWSEAEQGRRGERGCTRAVVALELAWNLAFAVASAAALIAAAEERPPTPIRAWIFGYALQCLIRVGFVCFEYRRRRRRMWPRGRWWERLGHADDDDDDEDEEEDGSEDNCFEIRHMRPSRLLPLECFIAERSVKKLETLNALISALWWMLGFYWIVVGGQALLHDAPHLYWLAVVYLAFDMFFAIFCILLVCLIGIALCCCFPCIIVFLASAVVGHGASDADISAIPKLRFCRADTTQNFNSEEHSVAIAIEKQEHIDDLALPPEDSECCICLAKYEDGVELHLLRCNHHFHTGCVVKWLRINVTCPLCKYNILEGDELF
ncbi:E3 ubiquitin protein ligase RIE1 [Ananas comosus]|uniref:RING-type E3 ubiquitin transferase n=1 Tax=Ananas comosus TaxID=4615 RepID=A0A199VSW9_ANACO|nr:E3 ubiquitin protein ligase RIE1 [Ananas comosus]